MGQYPGYGASSVNMLRAGKSAFSVQGHHRMQLYHNPRCSKSRQALQLLRDGGVEPELVLYLESPPDVATLDALCRSLGVEPTAILRFKEDRAKELGLKPTDERTRAEWLQLLAGNPILIERPIAVEGQRAVVGRPPEQVLVLLG
jgi:arsenate reductase (glutaredoxin)